MAAQKMMIPSRPILKGNGTPQKMLSIGAVKITFSIVTAGAKTFYGRKKVLLI
jgi:hypothetical protein